MRLRLTFMRNPVLLLGVVLSAVAILCGSASGDASQYPSPLYLSGLASSLSGSYQLVTSQGLGANAVGSPTWGLTWGVASPQAAVTGGVGTGNLGTPSAISYTYRYTLVDAGGETVPSTKTTAVLATAQNITVSGLPTGATVRLYRQNGAGAFKEIVELANNASSTYLDSTPDGSVGAVLPQAQTRTAALGSPSGTTGWFEFQPGVATNDILNSGAFPNSPPLAGPAFDGKGWVVDGAGNVAFPAGPWSVTVKVVGSAGIGTARLAIGMWKESGGSAVGSPLIDASCSAAPCVSGGQPGLNMVANIATVVGTANAITTSFASMPAFSLAAGQHLYVQFYRDQTAASSGSTTSTLNAYDNIAQITHPTASTLPNDPTLVTPADATVTNAVPQLTATFSDPDAGDTGTVSFRVCSAAAAAGSQCLPLVTSGSSPTVANGANGSWTPGALSDGTYYWQALATDATGGQSNWTATRSFRVDTALPVATITASPPTITNATSATFSFSANEAGTTFKCTLDGGTPATCTGPVAYSGLSESTHTFRVDATDLAGNTSSASYSWTVDTTPPVTTITGRPLSPTNWTDATFSFGASEGGSTFKCQLDDGAPTACTSPASYGGLGEGDHTFHVEATDLAGNASSTSAGWTVDTTPPDTTINATPSSPTNATSASFGFGSSEGGSSFQCQLDDGPPAPCTSPAVYDGLREGSHTFSVEATDQAGNTDPSPASQSWTVDTTPPGVPASFAGTQSAKGLILSWWPPSGGEPIGGYVLYVNGVSAIHLDGDTTSVYVGRFGPDDPRNFAVTAVDKVGNEGSQTEVLAGVPDLVGLRLSEADAALEARGLAIGKQTLGVKATGGLVVAQRPAAGSLAPLQSTVFVSLADAAGRSKSNSSSVSSAPLVVHIAGGRTVSCTQSSRLTLQIQLDRQAKIAVRFLSAGGVPLALVRLRTAHAGSQTLRLKLPSGLSTRKSYHVIVTARTGNRIVRAEIKLTIVRAGIRTKASSSTCA